MIIVTRIKLCDRFQAEQSACQCWHILVMVGQRTPVLVKGSIKPFSFHFIANVQPRGDAKLLGGSLIKPCAKVPRQNKSRIDEIKNNRLGWFFLRMKLESES